LSGVYCDSHASEVKDDVLGVPAGPVVSIDAARRVLGANVGLALTGVAGPDEQEGRSPGTVIVGLVRPGAESEDSETHRPGDRDRVRQEATITALGFWRRRSRHDGGGAIEPPGWSRSVANGGVRPVGHQHQTEDGCRVVGQELQWLNPVPGQPEGRELARRAVPNR
jgi:hypothetical protein